MKILSLLIFFSLFATSCFDSASEEESGGGLFSNHKEVENGFELYVPSNQTFSENDTIDFLVRHPATQVVTGTPRIALDIGGSTVYANFIGGSGSKNLVFRYTVVAGDNDSDGIEISPRVVDLNGGTITFTANGSTQNSDVNLPNEDTSNLFVDTQAPSITIVAPPVPLTYMLNETLQFYITFDEPVDVSGTPRLQLDVGGSTVYANYVSGGSTSTLYFAYQVQAGDKDLDGIAMSSPLGLNGGSITDDSGNNADLTFAPVPMPLTFVNGDAPYVIGVAAPSDKTYYNGEMLQFDLTFNEIVNVGGNPRIALDIGGSTVYANYTSGTGTDTLSFRHIVTSTDLDNDGVQLDGNIDLNGGSIADGGAEAATLDFSAPLTPNVLVYGAIPTIVSITAPADANYTTSQTIDFDVEFSENVVITGNPRIPITLDSGTVYANYLTGSNTKNISFRYTVAVLDNDNDGIAFGTTSIDINASSIVSALTASTADLNYNGTEPTVTGIKVNEQPATQLAITTQPTNTLQDATITPALTVEIRDASNNLVSNSTANVTVAIGTDPSAGSATLAGTLTVAAVGGIATFSDLDIDTYGTGYTLSFTSTGLTGAVSNTFDIQSLATQLVITQEPNDAYNNTTIAPAITVEIRDASNNLVTGATSNVTVAFNSDPSGGSATLAGTLTVAAVGGIATFSDLDIDEVNNGYTLDFTSTGLTTATSASFNITQAPATQLAFIQQPTNALAGDNIAPALTVEIQDAGGNRVASATDNITLSFGTDASGGSATLGGTLTVAAIAGVATFSDINIDRIGTGYTLIANATGLTADTSTAFNIDPNVKSQLSFRVEPSNTEYSTNIAPAIEVEILDAYGNRTADTDTITLAINNNPSAGTLGGTVAQAAVAGVATFADIQIDNTGVGYTLDATATGITTATSTSFDIIVTPTQLIITQEPTDAYNEFNIAPAITVEIRDASNNLVTGATNNVSISFGTDPSGGSAVLGGSLTVAAIGGIATFNNINIDEVNNGYTLLIASTGLTSDTSDPFNITQAPATQLAFVQNPSDAVAGVANAPSITVEVQDANGNIVPTATDSITLSVATDPSAGAATLGGTLTVAAASGVATFNDITLDKAFNNYALRASATGLTQALSSLFNITPAAKASLAFVQEPTDALYNTNIAPAITVEILDAFGNRTTDTDTITLSINNNPSAGTLGGTVAQAAVAGLATFNDIQIDNVGNAYTLDANATGLTLDTSAAFNITAGTPTQLAITTEPSDTVAGVNINPAIVVEIQDAGGNLVPTATDNVTIAFNNNAGSGTLGGTLTVAAIGGVATFSDINIDKAATGYTLDVTATGLTLDTSVAFNITPAAKASLAFVQEPTDALFNTNIAPAITVEILDAYGNRTTDTDTITLSINNNPGAGTLAGTVAQAAVAGLATFSDIQIDNLGVGYTLDANATGLTLATSAAFNIDQAATQLVITQEPTDAYNFVNINPAITVEIRDGSNNLVPAATNNVTLSFGTDPSGGAASIGGTVTVAAVGGVATFADINIDTVNNGYTFTFSATGLTSDTSNTFNITQAPATQLVFTQEPTNTVAGVNIAPAMTVEIQDAGGNRVTSATDNITLAFGNDASGGSATLGGTLTVAAVAGVATFSDINIDKTGIGYTFTANATGLTADTSTTFDISAAAKAAVAFVQEPTDEEYDTNIAPAITVEIVDAFGNRTADTDTITLAINNNPGAGTLSGTVAQAAVAGLATFSDIQINNVGTGYTLDATATGLTLDTSAAFNIIAVPTQLVITQEPSDAYNLVDISPAITIEIRDANNNLVVDATNSVALAFGTDPSGGAASIAGTVNVAAVNGIATFNDIDIDTVNNGYTFSFTSAGLTSATSVGFNITQAPATQLAFIQEPTDAVAGVNIAPSITVEIQDAGGNRVTSANDNITLSFSNDASGGSATLGGTLTVAASSGLATFSNINIDKSGTGYTLGAAATGLTSTISSSFNITPAAKAGLAFVQDPTNAEYDTNIAPAITVEIVDAFGNRTADTDTITLNINNNPGGGTLAGTVAQAATAGLATFSDIQINNTGVGYTLDATATGLTLDTSAAFNIEATPTQLVIKTQPTDSYNLVDISPSIEVEIRDASNNLVNTATNNITLAFGTDPSGGAAVLAGTTSKAAVSGVATFDNISIDTINNGYTFSFTSTGLTSVTSVAFNITQAPPTQLAFVQQPTDATAGVDISPAITVEIQDAAGNRVTGATDNVTIAFQNDASGGSAVLAGTLTVAAVNGVATFSDIDINKSAANYTLNASATGLTDAISDAFTINAGTAVGLAFVQQPTDTPSDANITPGITVAIVDTYNNQTNDSDTITLAFDNDPSGGSANLTGTLVAAASNGLATFPDINIDTMGLGYRLDASSPGLGNISSSAFNILAGSPTQIVIIQQPTTSNAGENINPAITAQLMDANNNLVTTATNTVTLSFNADPSGGAAALGGTLSKAAVAGVVTFDDINIDTVAVGYSFDLASTGLPTVTTNTFEVEAAGPSYVAFTSQPATTIAGAVLSPIVVEIKNGFGVTVTDATDFITIRFKTDPSGGGATLSGSVTKAAVNGVATFNNISIDRAFTGYTLEAEVFGLTKDESDTFDINPGPKAALTFAVQPSSANLSTSINPSIVVHTTDALGNLVTGTENITLSLNADPTLGVANLGGTLTRAAVNGIATFNDISLDVVANGYSLNASTSGLTSVSSSTFGIYGPPTQIVFYSQPLNTVIGNNLPSFQVAIADANGTPVNTETDTVTIAFQNDASGGGANLTGTLSVAAVNGVATFSGINVDLAYADYTFVASATGYSNVISAPFDITLSPPSSITLVDPSYSPSDDTTPTVRVATVASGDLVKVYTDSNCSSINEVASITATGSFADITMAIALPEGQNQLFANRTTSSGSISACSSAFLTYEVSGAFYQLDDLSGGFGNWTNAGGDDGNWTVLSGETPSLGAGPTTGAGLTGNYAYIEASNPTGANDVFNLTSNTLDGAANPLAFNFKWNKRGDTMGDLFIDVSSNGGGSWTNVWSHVGADIPLNGSDIWRSQFIDLCNLGYTGNNVQIRVRGVMPPNGDIWNSDMAVDDLEVSSAGCAPAPPATITIATPLPSVLISPVNEDAFTVSGACSDDGQNVIFSGDVSGVTSCSSGTYSYAFNASTLPDGPVLIRADHLSAAGGANGTTQVTYTKDSTIISFDDFENGYGEWVNVEYESADSRWVTWSGGTPTNNVGPTSDRSGSGNYVLIEASTGYPGYGAADKDYVLESPTYDATNLELNIEFYWNKRGSNMGDLFLEVDEGSGWTVAWSHAGQDVASGGTDVWNRAYVDLCALGYTNPNTKIRFRGRLPSNGNIANSDMGLDEVKLMNTGCSATPSAVGFTTDENILILPSNAASFPIAGTCSDNGEVVVASGDGNGSTTCSGGLWSMNLDVSSRPEGDINITVTHNAASGGVDGTDNITFSKTSIIFSEDFEGGFGNFTNVGGDDEDWSTNTGNTPSNGVGPSSGQGGGGQYVYTEVSGLGGSESFILESVTSYDLSVKTANVQFYWNKRGDFMGTISLEVNPNGAGWVTVWSHTGTDIARNGTDIWNVENVDICALGYQQANTEFRFVATAPDSGTVWHGDIGIDSVMVVNNGCQ